MTSLIDLLRRIHDGVFDTVERLTDGWFLGLLSRFIIAATLYTYYLNSALTKVGDGFGGFFEISDGAYIQIAGKAFEAAGYDTAALPFTTHLMVFAGTYGEFILPILVILGLFARVGSVGMIIFIVVQTYVDVTAHGVALGTLFDGQPGQIIDQRLFWIFPLIYVALKGPGLVSLDTIVSRWWSGRRLAYA
ncbi:DoxX family protein [Hoeflea prorocentri]|uniref:DoxX family protein n=1 Tax=Hoeflea prorocentri TaxID=1922333 RepID=A0A9X3ZF28_9HYPH|nr:DoxX family protein [Hoeflea prorocentri]MCY6379241.1 DoxX family protein [Hoeflea prorocentri]MDA5397042.1 DoxX family protein [Hoeflea prorocentri]